ncbi:hypothetical protein SLS62_005130 [Diatrype stigma]|uniref:RNase H type-1 domain-containing protein n=1 Tax=Diatrype stigma TaxID=117547 RepID=A0AAN9UT94_9PEZI
MAVSEVLRDLLEDVIDESKTAPELAEQPTGETHLDSRDSNSHDNSNDADNNYRENLRGTVSSTGYSDSEQECTPSEHGRRRTQVKPKPRKSSDSSIETREGIREDIRGRSKSPKIVFRERTNANSFAAEAAEAAKPTQLMVDRMVIYANAVSEDKGGIRGVGITYKCFPGEAKDLNWNDESYGILGAHNIDITEMLAIGCALKTAIREAPSYVSRLATAGSHNSNFGVVIFTESQAALQSIQRHFGSDGRPSVREAFLYSQSSAEIPGLLENLGESGALVELHWVPGQSGVVGNIRAHRLASDAAEAVKPILPYHGVTADGRDFEVIPVEEMVRERANKETEQARARVRSVIETQSSEYFRDHHQRATTPEELLLLLDQIKSAVEGTIIQQHQEARQLRLTELNRGAGAIDSPTTLEIPTPTTMITDQQLYSEPLDSEPISSVISESTETEAEEDIASPEPESPGRTVSGTTMVATSSESTTLSDRPESTTSKPGNKGKPIITRFKLKNTFRKVSGSFQRLAHGREGRVG